MTVRALPRGAAQAALVLAAACGGEVPAPVAPTAPSLAASASPDDPVLELGGARFVGGRDWVARHDPETGIVTYARAFGGRGGLVGDGRALFALDPVRGVVGVWPVGGAPRVLVRGVALPATLSLTGAHVVLEEPGGRVVRVPRPDAAASDEMLAPGAPPARR